MQWWEGGFPSGDPVMPGNKALVIHTEYQEAGRQMLPALRESWLMRTLSSQAQPRTEEKEDWKSPSWEPEEDGHGESQGRWSGQNCGHGGGKAGACYHSNTGAPTKGRCQCCAV